MRTSEPDVVQGTTWTRHLGCIMTPTVGCTTTAGRRCRDNPPALCFSQTLRAAASTLLSQSGGPLARSCLAGHVVRSLTAVSTASRLTPLCSAQLWLAWDAAAGQYIPAEGQLGASAATGQPDAAGSATGGSHQPAGSAAAADAAPSALPTSTDAYTPLPAACGPVEPAAGPATAADGETGPVAAAAGAQKAPGRRRGATIGSAPQLSQQGLQAALRQAEVT